MTYVFQPNFQVPQVLLIALVVPKHPHALFIDNDQSRVLSSGRERFLHPFDAPDRVDVLQR